MRVLVVKDSDRDVFIQSRLSGRKVSIYVILCDKSVEEVYQQLVEMSTPHHTDDINKYLDELIIIVDFPNDAAKSLKYLDDLVTNKYAGMNNTVFVVADEAFSNEIANKYNEGKNLMEVLV